MEPELSGGRLSIEDPAGVTKETKETKETIRTYFPETWIWELVSVG